MNKTAGLLFAVILPVIVLPLGSCHNKLMVAMDTYEQHDEFLILYRNGWIKSKTSGAGMNGSNRNKIGRYYLSGDTVYLAPNKKENMARDKIFGIIDTARKIFLYQPGVPDRYTIFTLVRYNALKVP